MADPPIGPPQPAQPAPATATPGSVTLYDKETSAPVVVDAEHAHAAILSGQLNYAPGTRVPVRMDGKIGTVDADELGDAVAKYGAKPVTAKAFHEHELQQQYGSAPQTALAFGTNALDSATIGASNALIGGLGGAKTREYLRNITEANPTAATAGDVAGFVAPVVADVFSGGTLTPALAAAETARLAERGIVSAATRGVEKGLARTAAEAAILGPTKAVSAVGDLAEGAARAIVGKNAESASARVAQNIIAGGARGVAEGGLYGVGAEAGHQFLQDDPQLTGETLATAWVHGALLGGALGGITHGIGGMLTRKAPRGLAEESGLKAEGRVVSDETRALGEAGRESGVVDKAADAILSQVDDPKKRATLKRAFDERGPHGFAEHSAEVLDEAKRAVTKSLDDAIEAGHVVDMASFGDAKAAQMGRLVPKENLAVARSAAMEVWADVTGVLSTLDSYATKGGGEPSIRKLQKEMKDFRAFIEKAKDPGALMMEIDGVKRAVGKEAKYGTSPFGKSDAAKAFGDRDGLYDRIARRLEDESTFGAGAVAQKEVNKATTDMLGNANFFNKKYTVNFESHAGDPVYRANDASISSFIDGLTKPAGDLNAESFALKAKHRLEFLDAVEKNYTFDAAGKSAIATERKALARMIDTIAKTSNDVAHVNQLKSILADENGHGIHGIIGLALDTVTKPGATLARLAELEATKNRALAKIDKGIQSVKAALGGSKKPGLTPKFDSPNSYEERRATVLAAASQPDVLHANLTGATAPITPHAPDVARSFQSAGIRTVQYLMTVMPKPTPRPGSLTPRVDMEDWDASDQQKDTYNRQYDMAVHPEHALALVANGTITPTHVAALKATNGATYAKQAAAVQKMLDTRTKPVPFEMEAPIKTFLGLPQMDPREQKLMQSNYQAPAAPPPGLKRPMKMGDTTSLNASNLK